MTPDTNNKPTFRYYSSNVDMYINPTETGWYIAYKTESGDSDAVGVTKKPKNNSDALSMLKESLTYEWYAGEFFAYVLHFGYHNINK